MADLNEVLKDNALDDEKLLDVVGGRSSARAVKIIYKSKESLYNGLRKYTNLTTAEIDALLANNNIKIEDTFSDIDMKKQWVTVRFRYDSTTKKWSVESITQI